MRRTWRARAVVSRRAHHACLAAVLLFAALGSRMSMAFPESSEQLGCGSTAKDCVALAISAMGGRERLESVKSVRVDLIGHTALMEQSYRQSPFITSYERDKIILDFAGNRLVNNQHQVWPESDPKQAESDATLVAGVEGCVVKAEGNDAPCSGADFDAARQSLALGPERILMTAASAPDLHFEGAETLRSTAHAVLAFKWMGIAVRVLVNASNHLPDAVETTQQFRDFWYFWGDVRQVVYFDNWQLVHGLHYPTNQVTERNGAVWKSTQTVDIEFNPALNEQNFAMDGNAAKQSAQSAGWKRGFRSDHAMELAPGVDLFLGSWNATIVKQPDGVVILETPISGKFAEGLFAEAKKRYPDAPIKAVLSTSDSWPHVGGIRFDVAQALPVYILDWNKPLLDRMVAAPHALDPDALEQSQKDPQWKIVSGRTEIGSGENRMVLFPLRGASTERQYMVYFPERRLLYASDTLVINPDHTLYDPELMREVEQVVEREHLNVEKVYSMHQEPAPWNDVVSLIGKAMS